MLHFAASRGPRSRGAYRSPSRQRLPAADSSCLFHSARARSSVPAPPARPPPVLLRRRESAWKSPGLTAEAREGSKLAGSHLDMGGRAEDWEGGAEGRSASLPAEMTFMIVSRMGVVACLGLAVALVGCLTIGSVVVEWAREESGRRNLA